MDKLFLNLKLKAKEGAGARNPNHYGLVADDPM